MTMLSSKIFRGLILSYFVLVDVNAMQALKTLKNATTQTGYFCEVTRYPDWNKAEKTIDIKVHYNGIDMQIENIAFHERFPFFDEQLSYNNIYEKLNVYQEIFNDVKKEFTEQILEELRKNLLEYLSNA